MVVDAGMAVLPHRFVNLKKVLENILPAVGRLYVHIDRKVKVPDILKDPKIDVSVGEGIGSGMKMRGMLESTADGFLCLDDDIFYPENYVDKMSGGCREMTKVLGTPVQVCVHGSVYNPGKYPTRFMGRRKMYSFWDALDTPVPVMMAGNGTTYYPSDLYPTREEFEEILSYKNIDDVSTMCILAARKAPTICLARSSGWLSGLPAGKSLQHSRPLDLIDFCVGEYQEVLEDRFHALKTYKGKLY